MIYKLNQHQTPLFDALQEYQRKGTVSFHVPGHKQGVGLPEWTTYVGKNVMTIDATIMPDLDSICSPSGVIKDAEALVADAYGVDAAHLLVNGTTAGIQAMIMSVCQPGDKIIIPRNAHRSVTSALILAGAAPVYVQPVIDEYLGIAMGVEVATIKEALTKNPDVAAVFLINPTYYGMTSDIKRIVELSHSHGVPVLVDEAHGGHFHFHPDLPCSGAAAGADLIAISAHKTMGSMTQSSFLLVNETFVRSTHVKRVLNLTQTTSPSYVLMASLDIARKQMAVQGRALLSSTLELVDDVRRQLNNVNGLYVFGSEYTGRAGCFAFDPEKITVNLRALNLSGYEAECILRQSYNIQMDLSDMYNVLASASIGDTEESFGQLVTAMRDIATNYRSSEIRLTPLKIPETPPLDYLPREAFYSEQEIISFKEALGYTSAETIMAYPPGIPIIVQGEMITQEILDYILELKAIKSPLQGSIDKSLETIRVVKPGREASLVIPPDYLSEIANS